MEDYSNYFLQAFKDIGDAYNVQMIKDSIMDSPDADYVYLVLDKSDADEIVNKWIQDSIREYYETDSPKTRKELLENLAPRFGL